MSAGLSEHDATVPARKTVTMNATMRHADFTATS